MNLFRSKKLSYSVLAIVITSNSSLTYAQVQASSGSTVPKISQKNPIDKDTLVVGKHYFISAEALNVRSSNSINDKNIIGKLILNDEVELINSLNAATPLVQVRIVKSNSFRFDAKVETYVSKDYLSEKSSALEPSKYFVIQNVATEKTRVYERCTSSLNCPHKMILETDMVVGRPEEGTKENEHAYKTWLGHAQISEWIKFYQDGNGHYPHWYKRGQDLSTIPKAITGGMSDFFGSRDWMIQGADGKKTIYGAFGWYAAKMEPDDEFNGVNYQWIHGTIGWGKDGDAAIDLTRSALLNMFSNPGSSGCTRLENRAVAYLRQLLPLGTDVYRVYARESTREKEVVKGFFSKKVTPLPTYADKYKNPLRWDYILLTNGAQESGGLTADANTILLRAISIFPGVNLIEQGSYEVDQYPNVVVPNYNQLPSSGKSGDRYEIDSGKDDYNTKFKGFYLIDEGRFIDYKHPTSEETDGVIKVSGLLDFRDSVPDFLVTFGDHNPPEIEYKKENEGNN